MEIKNPGQGVGFGEEIDKRRVVVWKPLADLQATNPSFDNQILQVLTSSIRANLIHAVGM